MNLHVFTTGRGTPYGLAAGPVIKVATRSDLARRWHDLIDVDAGRIATGEATIEQMGQDLFAADARCRERPAQTCAEAARASQRSRPVQSGADHVICDRVGARCCHRFSAHASAAA